MFEPLSPTAFGDRGVLSYSTCTARPDQVLLDSSFMLRALNPSEPGHVEAVAFLDRLDLIDTKILYTTLLELDVFDAAFDIGQDAAASYIAAWQGMLGSISMHWVGVDEVASDLPLLMSTWGLTTRGAVQVATAIAADVSAFVTCDVAFGTVPREELPLLISPDGVDAARRLRSGSAS
ncbi:hypothetical protein [Curtobacterium sp. C2H10]|uniref:type II toxin-antitoxin system VapC family toxin n=1 Tax=Curtobacterium sp. C2H10 TaxID=2736664 RepID=UPI0021C19BE9|nr:hypothetical protein [Curtobacterium sp. C2H10]MCT9620774.1 hypothetical protein [Curtobacterium sp. C2H10]